MTKHRHHFSSDGNGGYVISKRFLSFVGLFGLLFSLFISTVTASVAYGKLEKEVAHNKELLSELSPEVKDNSECIASLQAQVDNIERSLARIEDKLDRMKRET